MRQLIWVTETDLYLCFEIKEKRQNSEGCFRKDCKISVIMAHNTHLKNKQRKLISEVLNHEDVPKKSKRINNGKFKYECSWCSQRFPSAAKFNYHTRIKHLDDEIAYWESLPIYGEKKIIGRKVEHNIEAELISNKSKQLLYLCIACGDFASFSYDLMIRHCQNHILLSEAPHLFRERDYMPSRKYCVEIDDREFYVDPNTYATSNMLNTSCLTIVNCDYKLLKSDKWPAHFDTLTKPEIDKINCNSIYYFTRIVRLSVRKKQTTAPFMLFQCLRCMKYVDPYSMVLHVQQSTCDKRYSGFPCYDCGRPFLTETAMYLHYRTHKVTDADKKYVTILFKDADEFFENAFLLCGAGLDVQYALVGKKDSFEQTLLDLVAEAQTQSKTYPLMTNDARTLVIQKTQAETVNKTRECSEITNNVAKEEKVAIVYKCQCGLCFHILEFLFKHFENCLPESQFQKNTCICGLDFEKTQYDFHCNMHCQGFTKFIVKKVTICDEKIIDVKNVQENFKQHAVTSQNVPKVINEDQTCSLAHVDQTNDTVIEGTRTRDQDKQLCEKSKSEVDRNVVSEQNNLDGIPVFKYLKLKSTKETEVFENTEENQSMVDNTMRVDFEKISQNVHLSNSECIGEITENVWVMMGHEENHKYLPDIQKQQTPNINKNQIDERTEEGDGLMYETGVDLIELKQVQAKKSKIYTEDELLNEPDNSEYLDAEESLLTEDEGPTLIDDKDDDVSLD